MSGGTTTGYPVPDLIGHEPAADAEPAAAPLQVLERAERQLHGGRVLRRDVDCAATPSATDNSKGELDNEPARLVDDAHRRRRLR